MVNYYLVGGSIRDSLMNVKSKDVDYAVEASSYEEMVDSIKSLGGQIFLESPQYWTVRAKLPGKIAADFALCRKDGQYSDGRRPDSVEPATILEDLNRRDFTVNAIALNEEKNEYIDPHNGREDIENRLLRCVGDPLDRFSEDALRVLRAIRFVITKGFKLEKATEQAINDVNIGHMLRYNISVERKREELLKCFYYDNYKTLHTLMLYPTVMNACFTENNSLWLLPSIKPKV